eukprot:CAMPEP_0170174392 /NCGR_PEP_ID=MMETSP0040_2-20121228/7614_1 /TAXON_ID=641309 /ORGANISM="Lotharella oceanica, Strain CCMP622" /LENGTH=109 /DNA_ID=CAMNT_0010416001 /DNA_START=418 /DNA_END=744 /DNA_ORIENTATION=-
MAGAAGTVKVASGDSVMPLVDDSSDVVVEAAVACSAEPWPFAFPVPIRWHPVQVKMVPSVLRPSRDWEVANSSGLEPSDSAPCSGLAAFRDLRELLQIPSDPFGPCLDW